MGSFRIKKIRLHRVSLPLKKPFTTHLQTVTEREGIIVEMFDADNEIGLGECVAFSSPWYTEETVQTCWDALVKWLIPTIIDKEIQHPSEVSALFSHVKGNRMAKAAIDQAAWDLFARKLDLPLWRLLGGLRNKIDAGIVLTGGIDEDMYEDIRIAQKAGYKRVKLKVDQNTIPIKIKELTDYFSDMLFFADANGVFDSLGLDALLKFEQVGLSLIEQPFGEDEWKKHIEATRLMKTPIALDESIQSVHHAERMAFSRAGSIIVLKPGRVGGISESLKIVGIAEEYDLPIWIGGMIEFGISKAHNLALASLPQLSLPGDFSASTHFWNEDLIFPHIYIDDGGIKLSELPGIGVSINKELLNKYTIATYAIEGDI